MQTKKENNNKETNIKQHKIIWKLEKRDIANHFNKSGRIKDTNINFAHIVEFSFNTGFNKCKDYNLLLKCYIIDTGIPSHVCGVRVCLKILGP